MKKPYQVFWSYDGLLINQDEWVGFVDTDDPVRAEQMYFKLCKKMIGKTGFVFVHSTDPESVPPARFNTSEGIQWNADREEHDIRRWMLWSMPEEIPYKRWRAPTTHMIKGLKASIILRSGKLTGCEISGERIGRVMGRSARGVRYWVAQDGESRHIDYASLRLLLEMAGFALKPISTYL